ncbi:Ras guanine nucleotide exchange factor bud5 [Coemansia aciculifera]|uniref:Ras guanine nucleotide exchange factor bud5 n=1 Tax=Coemansia aciculifera TaxID=417176 RepID=A0A9W8IQW6_9FUNG|nr:Ras guanine nucleotide exchange factor bud5 [Coemansia aciculifera]KAJ2873577.1 Ras guanine nucleotide exchange factor bud5 [Coemansia aciculifera]
MLSADTANNKPVLSGLSLALPKSDFMNLNDISLRIKIFREPLREIMRNASISTNDATQADPGRMSLLARVKDHLDSTQRALQDYLLSLPGAAAHSSTIKAAMTPARQSSDRKPSHLDSPSRSRSSTQGSHDSTASRSSRSISLSSTQHPMPAPYKPESYKAPGIASVPPMPMPSGTNTIERAISRVWRDTQLLNAPAKPASEMYVRLGKRHMASLEERVPQIPIRQLIGNGNPINIVDLVNSLFRSSAPDNEASLLTKHLESIPPGIVACAIANSAGQLLQRLTPDSVKRYVRPNGNQAAGPSHSGSALPVLRLLSDHANFLTRLMEMTITYPLQAAQRARRIEWWAVVACLLRELGDYESLSSLVCVFSSNVIGRLRESWELVSSQCKAAIRFILDRVLKIHPNYSNYREELQLRVKRVQTRRKKRTNTVTSATSGGAASAMDDNTEYDFDDTASLDFDCAVAINSPDFCSLTNEHYVNSCVFSKESFDLPPARSLIPIVAVLLKDAVSSESAGVPPGIDQATYVPAWVLIIESCAAQDLPLPLDQFMLRRIFATELSACSSLSQPVGLSTPRNIASSLLKRMPRRHSSSDRGGSASREMSLSECRVQSADQPPNILDLMAHLLFSAAGHPCVGCSVGAPLEGLHASTSGQLAVLVTSLLLFAEPWIPCEHLSRLGDIREPRIQPSPHISKSPQYASLGRSSMSPNALGVDARTNERPWLMSFKLNDTADSGRYSAKPAKNATPVVVATASASSKHASIESARKTSTDSDKTCVNRPPSPSPTQPGHSERSNRPSAEITVPAADHSAPVSVEARRSLSTQSAHSTTSNSATLPQLPPLPVNAKSPPLPSVGMPTWLPAAGPPILAKSPQMPRSKSLPTDAIVAAPPPLPAHPMPKFQPSGQKILSPPLVATLGLSPPPPLPPLDSMPPMPGVPALIPLAASSALSSAGKKHPENISAEAQMLLSFEAKTHHR